GKEGIGALTLLAIGGDCGEPAGFLCEWTALPTTEKLAVGETELGERELWYRLIAETAGEYIWGWDLATDRVVRNAGVKTLFGYRPEEMGDELAWGVSKIHPKDRDGVMRQLRAAIEGSETSWSQEYRFRRADGSYAEVATRGHIVRDGAGRAV